MPISTTLFASNRADWGTPYDLFWRLDALFGPFSLDAAANVRNGKCERVYTEIEDGLKQPWDAVTFCNPPYGRDVGRWVEKAVHEVLSGNCPRAVLLLAARTDTRWFHDLVLRYASQLLFVRGRVHFDGGVGPAPFPSMIAVFERGKEGPPKVGNLCL
jgi:phage N-6-adenine-methyltransferase